MSDVVDSDELLRRMQRARARARQELRTWRTLAEGAEPAADAAAARTRQLAYEVVVRVLDEILTPGSHGPEPGKTR
ncbi:MULTISPECIES: hypothetical protein [unclassified Streptomyces]|uniref:hypothetical protein n=1 Tax=unclassified Streptomyces TaxID=2593676 RepID=UPI003D73A780